MRSTIGFFFSLFAVTSCQSTFNLLGTFITYSLGPSQVNFTLTSPLGNGVSPSNAWLGIGFNNASQMSGAGVVACIYSSGTAAVQTYLNTGYNSALLSPSNPTLGITNGVISIADGNFTCSFTRDLANAASGYFDLSANPQPYLEVAYGTPVNGALAYHAAREVTSSAVSLTASNTTSVTTTAPGSKVLSNSFQSGIFNVQWTSGLSDITFSLVTQASGSSNIWTAIGFSTDAEMGSDDVVACVYSTGLKGVVRYYNQGTQPVKQSTTSGISSASVTLENGALKCSFNRAFNLSNDANFYNLANSYYLLSAYGPTDDSGNIKIHTSKVASSASINFVSCSSSGGEAGINPKYKAHGALMVIAWLFCASTGILIARYYKHIFPNKKPFKLAMWFFIHRPLMIFVPVLSVIAFVVILAAEKWKWIPISSKQAFAHSIFGILAVVLSIIQVVIAFFRLDKDHPKRFIFNHFHRFVGVSSFLLATIAIFIGVLLDDMQLGNTGLGIMIAWVIWVVFLPIIIEVVQFVWRRKHRTSATDMDQNKEVPVASTDERKLNKIKAVMLVLHLLVAFSLTLALVIVIATAQSQSTAIVCKS